MYRLTLLYGIDYYQVEENRNLYI